MRSYQIPNNASKKLFHYTSASGFAIFPNFFAGLNPFATPTDLTAWDYHREHPN